MVLQLNSKTWTTEIFQEQKDQDRLVRATVELPPSLKIQQQSISQSISSSRDLVNLNFHSQNEMIADAPLNHTLSKYA